MNIKARRADGGYVFDGAATFLSGSSHADWLVIGGWLHDDDGPRSAGRAYAAHRARRDPDRRDRASRHVAGERHARHREQRRDARRDVRARPLPVRRPGPPASAAAIRPRRCRCSAASAAASRGWASASRAARSTRSGPWRPTKVALGGSGPLAERTDVQIDVARARGLIEAGAAFLRRGVVAPPRPSSRPGSDSTSKTRRCCGCRT